MPWELDALQPFSVGPRNCIGKKFVTPFPTLRVDLRLTENSLAYVEMRLILVRLIWGYDLTLVDDVSRQFLECKAFSLWMKGPLNVCLTPVARE